MKPSFPARQRQIGIPRDAIIARILEYAHDLQHEQSLAKAFTDTKASEFDLSEVRLQRVNRIRGQELRVGFHFVFEGQQNEKEGGLTSSVAGHALARLYADGTLKFNDVRVVSPSLWPNQSRKQTAICANRMSGNRGRLRTVRPKTVARHLAAKRHQRPGGKLKLHHF